MGVSLDLGMRMAFRIKCIESKSQNVLNEKLIFVYDEIDAYNASDCSCKLFESEELWKTFDIT